MSTYGVLQEAAIWPINLLSNQAIAKPLRIPYVSVLTKFMY